MFVKLDFVGNPYIGVYCTSSEELLVVSTTVPKRAVQRLSEALGIPAVQTTIGGSTVVGSLVRLNSHGVVVSGFATDAEIEKFKGFNVLTSPHKLNAMGNNILCNDRGALVHPGYDGEFVKNLEDVLDVEVTRGTIAGIRTVGSWGVATEKGVLCHPHATDEEKALLERVPQGARVDHDRELRHGPDRRLHDCEFKRRGGRHQDDAHRDRAHRGRPVAVLRLVA